MVVEELPVELVDLQEIIDRLLVIFQFIISFDLGHLDIVRCNNLPHMLVILNDLVNNALVLLRYLLLSLDLSVFVLLDLDLIGCNNRF